MRKKTLIMTFIIAGILVTGLFRSGRAETVLQTEMVTASKDALLAKYEKSDMVFEKLQIEKIVSYFHQRRIGEAIVEKDFIRYQFNTETGELIEQKKQWRSGLPEQLTEVISREQAEAMAEGVVQFTMLYFISPESDVFPIEPTPDNPCWVVRSIDGTKVLVTIIDAMTGEKLGYGIPPPYEGLSINGPDHDPDCAGCIWPAWAENARYWFDDKMGYSTQKLCNATQAQIQSHVQSNSTAMFYELDHGGSTSFKNTCDDNTYASEIETWITNYASMPFAFIGSCEGLCDTSDNTFSYEFRKGSNVDAVTVGYCNMSADKCSTCWGYSISWQTALFDYMDQGYTAQQAFNHAMTSYPTCAGTNNCMRIAGDTSMYFSPTKVIRARCGSYSGTWTYNSSRANYIQCDVTAIGGGLTINPNVDLIFLNNSKITGSSTVSANGSTGQIRFVSENDTTKGMEFTGQLRLQNGGQIKIYE